MYSNSNCNEVSLMSTVSLKKKLEENIKRKKKNLALMLKKNSKKMKHMKRCSLHNHEIFGKK